MRQGVREQNLAPARSFEDDVSAFDGAKLLTQLRQAIARIFDGEPSRRPSEDLQRILGNINSNPMRLQFVDSFPNDLRPSHILVFASVEPMQVCVREPQI
jgi:hypothetical protein